MGYQPYDIPLSQEPPTRMVPSGTITLLANTGQTFLGTNARQDRVWLIVTNLDPAVNLKLRTTNNINCGTFFPQRNIILKISSDVIIFNESVGSVQCEVLELYPDTGNLHGVPVQAARAAAAPVGAGAPGGGGGLPGGGGTGGTSGGGYRGGGGTHVR